MNRFTRVSLVLLSALFLAQGSAFAQDKSLQVTIVTTSDGVEVVGQLEYGGLPASAPIIALFHQAGSNGRGEYGPLFSWLNENGFSAIAWDLRKGGDHFGSVNITAQSRKGLDESFCDSYPDMVAAVEKTIAVAEGAPVIIWGSSYSASLVFRAAAEIEGVDAVIAFSPASGGPMVDCHAGLYVNDVSIPAFALRPASEMESENSKAQRVILESAGVKFAVIENGVHGSSMLVDDRTGHDMSSARAVVMAWLKSVSAIAPSMK